MVPAVLAPQAMPDEPPAPNIPVAAGGGDAQDSDIPAAAEPLAISNWPAVAVGSRTLFSSH